MTTLKPPLGSSLKCYVCVYNEAQIWKDILICSHEKLNHMEDNLSKLQKFLERGHVKAKVVCRGCKMQRYCGVPHLLADRAEHQPICQVLRDLQKIMKINRPLLLQGRISDRRKLQLVISQLKLILSIKLDRPLLPREIQLIGNPAVCEICFSTGDLEACVGCAGVAYCSEKHRHLAKDTHSSMDCRTLALISTAFRQMDCLISIRKFYESSPLKESHLIEAFIKATSLKINDKPWTDLQEYYTFASCSSFSGIASLCLALSNISWVHDPDKVVIIYVVGATEEHLRYFQSIHIRFLFLQYPSIRNLELHFIGKELGKIEDVEAIFDLKNLNRTVLKRFYSLTFSQFANIYNVDPTLILILQPDFINTGKITQSLVCGLTTKNEDSDQFDWQECLSIILRSFNVPICYTSISKIQAMSDLTAINTVARNNNITVQRVYNITENPYREILPVHNPSPEDTERVVYANNYLEVIFTNNKTM
ncbi:uncharacterized protein LOC108090898 [Drosophila ficusphila]|uniref:uncharacterized protein LOC108090898 n=1 Tax=Drosophila ficusphila TaxID=30025 RepID=UPI0007E845C6|nr:uncharacterized protein LOC108090898 [Drosophila ficusphila]